MALPLPKVVADTGPGGGLVTAMGGINSLQNDMLLKKINEVKAQYAPLTTQAEAASKLAYANLMGPQFLSKLMGNPDIMANMTPEQRMQALSKVYQAGTGQGTGNALMGGQLPGGVPQITNPMAAPQPQQNVPFSTQLTNKLKDVIGLGDRGASQSSPPNALLQQPGLGQQDQQAIANMKPGDTYTVKGTGADSGMSYDQNGNNVVASPEQVTVAAAGTAPPQNQNTYAENAAQYSGIKKEGEEAGKIRADDIKDLADIVYSAQTKQTTLDNISQIISSPEFEQIRQTPALGEHELSYFQRYGTPAQQNMVGQLMTLNGNVIASASQDFKGSFRKGEQQLLESMKVNPGDTFNAMRGKMEQLSYLNKMIETRAGLTADIMQKNHMSKLDAEKIADKQINGDMIRSRIHNQLNPKPTDADIKFMADKYKVSIDEIKKRLKAKGVY